MTLKYHQILSGPLPVADTPSALSEPLRAASYTCWLYSLYEQQLVCSHIVLALLVLP